MEWTARNDARWILSLGGWSAIAGAILGVVGNLLHPATSGLGHPAETARVAAASHIWIPLHLALLMSFMLMLGGLVAIHDSLLGGLSGALARFGLVAGILGTAGGVVFAKHLAESWSSTVPALRAEALAAFRAEDSINFALLSPLNLVFAGFTFVLFGLAAALSQVYPRWLGWIAVAGGAGGPCRA